ncbi:Hint domain-containing protein [Gluconobacter cerinus]|nr:Hint domain-containing protein [Gluconobacter cerinus]MBS1036066.1 Hint domain-containing protein [Gluconobacter cerinus]
MSNIEINASDYAGTKKTISESGFDITKDSFIIENLQSYVSYFKITGGDKSSPQTYTITFYTDKSGTPSVTSFKIILNILSGQTITHTAGSDGVLPLSSWNDYFSNVDTQICFLSGSLITTPNGLIAVEDLSLGQDVIAYLNGAATTRRITWAGQAQCTVRPHLPLDQAGYPVRVLKNAIAEGVPFKDLLITAEHCLFFDGKFVPARMLVNGRSIFYDTTITSYDYYHIETEDHSVIMADGMLTESYLDTGNRRSFTQKGNVVSIGGSRALSWDQAAAPLIVSRETVEPIFRQIEARAENQACLVQTDPQPLTYERDLSLITNTGAALHQIREHNGRVMFMIPAGVESVRIVSNASRPCDVVGPFVDDRRTLGVLVGDVKLFEGNATTTLSAHLNEADLSGWNNVEDGTMRWTDGSARLDLGRRPLGSIALMALQIHAGGPYLLADTASEKSVLHA